MRVRPEAVDPDFRLPTGLNSKIVTKIAFTRLPIFPLLNHNDLQEGNSQKGSWQAGAVIAVVAVP